VIAVVDLVADEAFLRCVQGLVEPRVAAECCIPVVSAASELAVPDGGGNFDRECDIVGGLDGYLARSGPGLLLVNRDVGDAIGGIVGGSDEVCQL